MFRAVLPLARRVSRVSVNALLTTTATKRLPRSLAQKSFSTQSNAFNARLEAEDYAEALYDAHSTKVSQVLDVKGHQFYIVDPDVTVFDAVQEMVSHQVGSLLVMRDGELLGIITERDYLSKVIVEGRASKTTFVSEIMTTDLVCAGPDATVEECMELMLSKNCRHLPILENGELVGVLSMKDVMATITGHHREHIRHLSSQITQLSNAMAVSGFATPTTPRSWMVSVSKSLASLGVILPGSSSSANISN